MSGDEQHKNLDDDSDEVDHRRQVETNDLDQPNSEVHPAAIQSTPCNAHSTQKTG